MFEEEILTAAKITTAMIQKISTSKLFADTNQSIEECLKNISQINDKLDLMLKANGNLVFGKLKSANLSFEDFSYSNALTEHNVNILKELYISNTGLPLDEKTGEYNNNDIIAYSYLGLVLLENHTTQNNILIARYIMRMFHANNVISEQYFPEVYNSFFKEYVLMYECREHKFLIDNQRHLLKFETTYQDIGQLIEFYDLNIKVDDWTEGSKTIKEILFGKLLNKIIGPVNISPSNCNKLFKTLLDYCSKDNNKYSLNAVGRLTTKLTCRSILKKFDKQYYAAKRKTKVTRILSDQYLAFITSNLLD